MSVCIFILTIFSGFFTWKFRTYGTIEAKIQKLPELTEIEKSLANAKNSSEFEYWKKRGDSEKIISFSKKIIEANLMCIDISYLASSSLTAFCNESIHDEFQHNLANFDQKVRREDRLFFNLLDQIEIEFILYFEKYDSEFNNKYYIWRSEVNELHVMTDTFVEKARAHVKNIDHYISERNELIKIRDAFTKEYLDKKLCMESKNELFDAFKKMNNKIEKNHFI